MKSDVKKLMEKNRADILKTLPGFINQLLLLMNSGLILQDAFCRIAENYSVMPEKQQNYFTREICRIYDDGMKNNENVIVSFYNFSRFSNVKELTRVAALLMENRDRGTDLWEKLAEHGNALWEEHKRSTMEKIRLTESKMSFPLGILLIALIIITAAPAMMQI